MSPRAAVAYLPPEPGPAGPDGEPMYVLVMTEDLLNVLDMALADMYHVLTAKTWAGGRKYLPLVEQLDAVVAAARAEVSERGEQ